MTQRTLPLTFVLKGWGLSAGQVAAGTSLLMALLVQVHRISQLSDSASTPTHYSISRKAQQIEKFRSLLDKHFRTEHSLQAYADLVGVSVGQLSRLCREVLGKSSLDVINDRLLQEAQRVARRKTVSHQLVQRSQLVLLLHRDPCLEDEEAGRRVGLSGRQVRRWRRRGATGEGSLLDLPGRGRKAGFSPFGSRLGESCGL